MPYIPQVRRWDILVAGGAPETAGELNFVISTEVRAFMLRAIDAGEFGYQTLNDIIGALEGAKLEFVRRVVNPYEDKKIAENGDLYADERDDAHAPEAPVTQVLARRGGGADAGRQQAVRRSCGGGCGLPGW